jgi:DNA-directed RNA polymerase specialized sigma24 family protein
MQDKSEKLLAGILALLAAERDDAISARSASLPRLRSSESVLSSAGFTPAEIAESLGKTYEGVRSTLRREAAQKNKRAKDVGDA